MQFFIRQVGRLVRHFYLLFRFVLTILIGSGTQGNRERVGVPVKMLGPPARAERLNRQQLSLICRMTWDWSEGVNLFSRQIMILLIWAKCMQDSWAPGPLPHLRALVICTAFSPLSSAPVVLLIRSGDQAVGWTTEESELNFRPRQYILILSKASEPNVRPTQLPVQW